MKNYLLLLLALTAFLSAPFAYADRANGKTSEAVTSFLYGEELADSEKQIIRAPLGLDGLTPLTATGSLGGSNFLQPSVGQHMLLQNRTAGVAGRLHVEPNGNIDQGTTSKIDLMLDPYDDDQVNYRIGNMFAFTGSGAGLNGQNGVYAINAKAVGDYFGVYPSINFGFGDESTTGGGVLKLFYYDTGDTAWRTPMLGAWRAGRVAAINDYMQAGNKLYRATSAGTTGATKPSHTSGTVSDGSVNWLFVRDYSGGVGFFPTALIGNRDDMPKFGFPNARLQMAADSLVWNGKNTVYLDNTATAVWSAGVTLNSKDFNITSLTGGGALRFSPDSSFVQWNGFAQLHAAKIVTNNSATPDVTKTTLLRFDNTGATTVTAFTNSLTYQTLMVFSSNSNTTLQHGAGIKLAGGRDRTMVLGECLNFLINNGVAYQILGERANTAVIVPSGTTGAATVNASSGRVNFAAGATSLVATNSLVSTASIITATKATNDTTARLGAVVSGAGSFTIYMDVAPAGECAVNFTISN